MCCNLVPALWECMSADSCYSGLVLSVGSRSKALTVMCDGSLKLSKKKCVKIGVKFFF